MTMTGIEDIDASASLIAGWTSNSVNNTTDLRVDFFVSGQFTLESASQQAGEIRVYVYAAFTETPVWPDIFSSGTEGTVGAAAITDSEERDSCMALAQTLFSDGTASAVLALKPFSVCDVLGLPFPPPYWAIWVTGNTATTTADLFVSSGTALYIQPITA
jgi:hypothetical protein